MDCLFLGALLCGIGFSILFFFEIRSHLTADLASTCIACVGLGFYGYAIYCSGGLQVQSWRKIGLTIMPVILAKLLVLNTISRHFVKKSKFLKIKNFFTKRIVKWGMLIMKGILGATNLKFAADLHRDPSLSKRCMKRLNGNIDVVQKYAKQALERPSPDPLLTPYLDIIAPLLKEGSK